MQLSPMQQKADDLRRQAQQQLFDLFGGKVNGRVVDSFVECIIGAAMFELLGLQEQASQQIRPAPSAFPQVDPVAISTETARTSVQG